MEVKTGIPVSPGVAIARARLLDAEEFRISRRHIRKDEVSHEVKRWDEAKETAKQELERLKNEVKSVVIKDEVPLIFETHQRILEDPLINAEIRDMIKIDHYAPEYAVTRAFRKVINAFRELKNSFFGQRISDFSDIQRRLLRALSGTQETRSHESDEPTIVVAKDLTPSQTASLAKGAVQGFATDRGGPTSHTAILANALGIPAVVGLGKLTHDIAGGETIIIDGTRGRVIISPDDATRKKYEERAREYALHVEQLSISAGELQDETKDGVELQYLANIEFESEVEAAIQSGARGLGLYRTEFIYANNPHPSEEEHFQTICRALRALDGRPLTLRTLDFGADKFREELGLDREENPFLGYRSLRICLAEPELFRTQLRAIYRASMFGNIHLMLPMVSSLDELRNAKFEIGQVLEDLDEEGISYRKDLPVGVMIEVPSAALAAEAIAKECDFFSIGTNDLVQYSLAVDRNNPKVGALYRHTHPSVLGLISHVIKTAIAQDIPVSVCGEMASDPHLALVLLGMGLRRFSMAPMAIPALKTAFSKVTIEQAEEITRNVMRLVTMREIERYLEEEVTPLFGEGESLPSAIRQTRVRN